MLFARGAHSAMASLAAAGVAAAAIGAWYAQRKPPALSDFTEPPKTWGESVVRLHEVVRISWKEALSKLGVWRLDHLLAIRHLSSRDMSEDIAAEIARLGTKVTYTPEWRDRLEFIDLAMRYNRLLRGARSVEQIEAKLKIAENERAASDAVRNAEPRASILLAQLRPAILQPAFIVVKDTHARQLFLVIRGTHSVRDTVTSLTAHSKPHHLVNAQNELVLGRAHAGFLSTARWFAKTIKPDLARALADHPGYALTVVGHSLGAGIAVVLTQALRESAGGDVSKNPFARTRCLAFACPSALSKELAESCAPFVTTVITGADIVPTVSFSKVSELQQQIVSAAWEQQVLKKWRETTRAMAAACAAPREGKGRPVAETRGGCVDSSFGMRSGGARSGGDGCVAPSSFLPLPVPGAWTCGFGGWRPTGSRARCATTAEDASGAAARSGRVVGSAKRTDGLDTDAPDTESIDGFVDHVAHLPGAAARGGGATSRPRRWLGAQMRSIRRTLGAPLVAPAEGKTLAKLASIGGALLAGCVAPRKPNGALGGGGGGGNGTGSPGGGTAERAPSGRRRTAAADGDRFEGYFGRASPTLNAQMAAEAAAAAFAASPRGSADGSTRNDDDHPDGVLDDDLDLDDPLSDARFLERLEGEAAQEVLKLQEELSVLQAADADGDGDGDGDVDGDRDSPGDGDRGQSRAERRLPAPAETTSDPVALLGPGAPESVRDAARSAESEKRAAMEWSEASGSSGSAAPGVDEDVLAERVATGKGGSHWGGPESGKSPSGTKRRETNLPKEDPDAFGVKLYPAGRILHMVLVDDAADDVSAGASGSSEGLGTGFGDSSEPKPFEAAARNRRYELYADVSIEAYDRIRLSKTMLSDHFLPKYLEALEQVRTRLEESSETVE